MNESHHNAELLQLLHALWSDELSAAQLARMQELLRDDSAAQQTYLAYLDLHLGLKQIVAVESEGAAPVGGWPVGEILIPATSAPMQRPPRFAWRWMLAASLLVAAGVLGIAIFSARQSPPAMQIAGTLTDVSGSVRVLAANGAAHAATLGMKLSLGERVETVGEGALAVLTFTDGTRLALVNDSSMTCANDEQKRVVLHQGVVSASVAPQPAGKPMLLTTPGTSIEVLGTRFALAATTDRTVLNVAEGRVRLTRVSDGQAVEVAQGQGVVSNGEVALTVRESAGPRDDWEVDFEGGLPHGWIGALVTENLPPGATGAIQAVREPGSNPTIYLLVSRDEWVEGMFAAHEDSHLHITLKMDHPNWLNVFLSARGSDATNPTWAMFNFNEVPFWPPKPGQWRTITIPLAKFRRKRDGVFHNEPPTDGEVVYSLSISATEPDRGLVIDRMWVTRGGAGEVVAAPLNLKQE